MLTSWPRATNFSVQPSDSFHKYKIHKLVNTLNPKSDEHLISPYIISPESHIKVMRMKEMISNEKSFWSVNKFSLSVPWELYKKQYGEQYGDYAFWYKGVKG